MPPSRIVKSMTSDFEAPRIAVDLPPKQRPTWFLPSRWHCSSAAHTHLSLVLFTVTLHILMTKRTQPE